MNKESTYLLQKIDCNCNNCGYLERDIEKYKKWADWHSTIELKEFERKKKLGHVRPNAQFQFDKSGLLYYGYCKKLKKDISFIPDICQLETQDCFKHRLDFLTEEERNKKLKLLMQ